MNKETHLVKLYLDINSYGISLQITPHRIKREHDKVYKLAMYNCNGMLKTDVGVIKESHHSFKSWTLWVKKSEVEYGKAQIKTHAQNFLRRFADKPITEVSHQSFN